jgi:hypothetical protein
MRLPVLGGVQVLLIMRTEVYINGELFDLDEETAIAASYGNISFGELSKRKGVKSNNWTGPFSLQNKRIFESCEVPGSNSEVPYFRVDVRVDVSGVTVFEGWGTLEESEEGYSIQSYAGATDFYAAINNKKLRDLDLSQYNHIWNESNIRNSWTNVDGYIYPFVEYGKEWPSSGPANGIPPDYLLPQLYFKDVVRAIAEGAGYTLSGAVLSTNDRYKKHLIISNNWPLPIAYGGAWDIAQLLPDLTQSKVWLDFANIYGLQFEVNHELGEIIAYYIDDALFNEPDDWTGKIDRSRKRKTKYRFEDYGQTSYLRFKYDPVTEENAAYQDFQKALTVADGNLKTEADIYKSEFYLIQDVDPVAFPLGRTTTRTHLAKVSFSGIWTSAFTYTVAGEGTRVWYNGTYYKAIQTSTNKVPASEPTYWTPVDEKDIWSTKSRPMYGLLKTDVSSYIQVNFSTPAQVTRLVDNGDLSWEYSYTNHYRLFGRLLNKTKRVTDLIKLNYADINQLRFDRLKRIDGELYVVDQISQYMLNRNESTIVDLIRV